MITIDLNGPQGNAFVLLGYARDLGRQLNIDFKPIVDEMTSGDYENLLDVFYENFGDFIDWNRDESKEDEFELYYDDEEDEFEEYYE